MARGLANVLLDDVDVIVAHFGDDGDVAVFITDINDDVVGLGLVDSAVLKLI